MRWVALALGALLGGCASAFPSAVMDTAIRPRTPASA